MTFASDYDYDYFGDRDEEATVYCRRCGAACKWYHDGERWHLYGNNGLHVCSEKKLHKKIAEDFEVLP